MNKMSASNPLILTSATRFQPLYLRGHSRSRSRSPIRKAQFTARELDPLLSNLSPDSTLKALQMTATITSQAAGQDALAKSISEASQAEREIGIRAAVAAQKLKQWYREVSQWSWPGRRDRGWGAGFLPPRRNSLSPATPTNHSTHLGYLPSLTVDEHEDRIEEIRDGIEALQLDDVKDHVFKVHIPQKVNSDVHAQPESSSTHSPGYGRMRDFTALITATVIQALPELANLNMLLDTWEIRLSVLRQIPETTALFKSTRSGIQTASSVVRDANTGPLVTMEEYEMTRGILGGKVALLGARIDKFLDMLEGQEDSLPKAWIDDLEDIENEYAEWVVEAEHIAIRNDLSSKASVKSSNTSADNISSNEKDVASIDGDESTRIQPTPLVSTEEEPSGSVTPTLTAGFAKTDRLADGLSGQMPSDSLAETKGGSYLAQPRSSGHNRGVSEISVADSTFSAASGLSTAEIGDARSTPVLTSPKISVVQNPFRASRDELSWITPSTLSPPSDTRPPIVQRASTASIEVILRDQVKQVDLPRSRSHDVIANALPLSTTDTPSGALRQLNGEREMEIESTAQARHEHLSPARGKGVGIGEFSTPVTTEGSYPLMNLSNGEIENIIDEDSDSPSLPRRSSKRVSMNLKVDTREPESQLKLDTIQDTTPASHTVVTPVKQIHEDSHETLEDRIKDILNTMPTKIRLAKNSDHDEMSQASSVTSTRSSTPMPSLTLSPVKGDRANRQAAPGDVRVFHLTRSGQSRDTPPIKLFVRAVGENGERVMVRVGGGWADLAEYLREYSLHHGHRGLADGKLEVASYPTVQTGLKDMTNSLSSTVPVNSTKPSISSTTAQAKIPRESSPNPEDLPALTVGKLRKNERAREAETIGLASHDVWTPPPVPPIPATYTTQTPTTVTTTAGGFVNTSTIELPTVPLHGNGATMSGPVQTSSVADGRAVTSQTWTSTPPSTGAKYIPLGAAGPRSNGRRAVTHSISSNADKEAWVEGMVGKARAVSNGTTIITGPTTTTTTTVISRSTPVNRRISSIPNMSSASSAGSASPATSISRTSPTPGRPKSRMSLSDVSGIKRVFLRRKSENK